ncbi:type I restriction-modification system subunit M [Gemmata sp. JC717]|uniref:class I SAM-dependent DNA methyltransferase n=1 Tax=Gemmata algarum TaxID=2975278 RepID=UPI0021BA9BC5|nr:type I restriction-modification system subunit M [Gemmata algarum]MDY3553747.1 type I restriction-modification system subunit M [Gemmata algarum]
MAKRRQAADAPVTTAQKLGALLKSARDIMRKDKGLNGDLDRLPLLTWLMFLKFLDDHEQTAETKAVLARKPYTPTIEAPYRWRDWGANDALTGDELLAFVSAEKTILPKVAGSDGVKEGPGLIPYLRKLSGSNDPKRQVVGEVFGGVINRMESGFLLRQIVIKVNDIHFGSSDEIHTLGHLYESMLKEMRDAAGDSGEFYTPRAVVKFMVAALNPRLGEAVLDPACGTGGFLVEAFAHLEQQARKGKAEDIKRLQVGSIFGQEAKPLPYMLCQMNLLLHGLDAPAIDKGNSLEKKITDITDAERVDVILTNPPFGGEEEDAIKNNFPAERQTKETALLFLQLIMRKLKMPPKPGRAAVVVPNGTLFGDGVCGRIKTDLLKNFNLHTIVRLPNGVFAPYTSIPTNILFFDRSGPTTDVWYYELPLPEGRKQYTKTSPLQFEEFAGCLAWWPAREENDRAWKVPAAELLANGCNLDRKNPRAKADMEHLPPEQLVESILAKEARIAALMGEIKELLAEGAK